MRSASLLLFISLSNNCVRKDRVMTHYYLTHLVEGANSIIPPSWVLRQADEVSKWSLSSFAAAMGPAGWVRYEHLPHNKDFGTAHGGSFSVSREDFRMGPSLARSSLARGDLRFTFTGALPQKSKDIKDSFCCSRVSLSPPPD